MGEARVTTCDLRTNCAAGIPLRVLLIDDSELDAQLVVEELRRGGYAPEWERVDTAAESEAALDRQLWDVIICDWVMPQFSGMDALALLRERHTNLPIIVVSGQVGEEIAVTAMRAGAHDFISKQNLDNVPGKLHHVLVMTCPVCGDRYSVRVHCVPGQRSPGCFVRDPYHYHHHCTRCRHQWLRCDPDHAPRHDPVLCVDFIERTFREMIGSVPVVSRLP